MIFDEVFDNSGEDAFEESQTDPQVFGYVGGACSAGTAAYTSAGEPRSGVVFLQRRPSRRPDSAAAD